MKKTIITTATVLSLAFMLSCKKKDNNVAVSGIVLNETTATLSLLDTLTLTPTVSPVNATDPSVTWLSSDTTVAKVSNGVVTPIANGTATITVSTTDGNKTDACAVTVDLLGKVTFKSNTVWTVPAANGVLKQEWSDVVMASGCKKDSYNGGNSTTGFLADCRQNPNYGDLFSWEAVNQFGNQLCPDGWRVPTMQDFIDLDKAMGGTGEYRQDLEFVNSKYISSEVWGGVYGGRCLTNGSLGNQGSNAFYWSQTEEGLGARGLNFGTGGDIGPQGSMTKSNGFTLRCVR
jgi:uncharacterized protein (TIGR02145 family)